MDTIPEWNYANYCKSMNENIRVINSNEFINSIVKLSFFILLLIREIYIIKYIERNLFQDNE